MDTRHKDDMTAEDFKKNKDKKTPLSWSALVRIVVTGSILAYLAGKIDWAEMGKQLTQSDPLWLLLACFLVGTSFVFAAIRWWFLLKVQRIYLPLRVVAELTLIGQFFNSFLLGSTGGDVVRVLYILKYAPHNKAHAALSIIVDRAMGLFVLLGMALLVLPWQLHFLAKHEDTRIIAYGLAVLFCLLLAGVLSLTFAPFHLLPSLLQHLWKKIPFHGTVESLVSGFRQYGRSWLLTAKAIAASIVIWLLVFTEGYCIAQAIHLNVTYLQILVILSIVICVISLPISIGGHGVREGIFIVMFSAFGVITTGAQRGAGQAKAVLFSLLFFMLLLIWSLVGGVFYLASRPHSPGASAR